MRASIRVFLRRLISFMRHNRMNRSLDRELEFHLEMEIAENLRRGMKPEEARRCAFIALGGIDPTKESYRDAGSIHWLEWFVRDLRHGLRMIARQPLQSAIIMGVLALGMAGTMTMFNLINAALLRPLPIGDQARVMYLGEINPATGNEQPVPYSRFHDWHRYNRSFESMAFSSQFRVNISYGGAAENADVRYVSHEFFDVLDIRPVLGRTFTETEHRQGAVKPVLLGIGLWKRMFNSNPAILGKTVRLDGYPSGPVIGILPDNAFPDRKGVWLPLVADSESDGGLGPMAVGRLKKGITVEQARADLVQIQNSWASQHPDRNATARPWVRPLRDTISGQSSQARFTLFVIFAIAALVLVIACCNVAGAMLARATYQSRELAMRTTLGATRGHIVRQVLAENLVLAIAASGPGVVLGWYALQAVLNLLKGEIPTWMRFTADSRCIIFGVLLVAGTTVLCGLLPALYAAAQKDVRGILQSSGARTAGSRGKLRTLDVIIVAQIALAMTLLVGAGLILRAYHRVQLIDPGFRTTGILTYQVPLSIGAYLDENKRYTFWEQHIAKVRALPGVLHAALVNYPPLSFPEGGVFDIEGRPNISNEKNPPIFIRRITPGYFATLDIPMLLGRDFSDNDNQRNSERTAIVDRSFARQFWPGENPIDKRIRLLGSMNSIGIQMQGSKGWIRVIGVVQDVKQLSLDEPQIAGVYLPQATDAPYNMYAVMQAAGEPLALAPGLRKSVQSIDTGVPVDEIGAMSDRLHKSMLIRRLALWMYGIPALIAVILAFAGIYGVTSYAVSRRTQEIGIRMALGARRPEVMRMVIGHALRLVLVGLIPGLLGALVLGRVLASMQSMLYDVGSADPVTLVCVPLFLTAAAVLACGCPARKATKIDPIEALRHE